MIKKKKSTTTQGSNTVIFANAKMPYAKRKNQNFVTGFSSSGMFSPMLLIFSLGVFPIVVRVFIRKNTTNIGGDEAGVATEAKPSVVPENRSFLSTPVGVPRRAKFPKEILTVSAYIIGGVFPENISKNFQKTRVLRSLNLTTKSNQDTILYLV